MTVTKDVRTDQIKSIVPLPDSYDGEKVTIVVKGYEEPLKYSREEILDAMGILENGINQSNKTLEQFRDERLNKYEVAN